MANILELNGLTEADLEPQPGPDERIEELERAVSNIDNADNGELAEIRAALVELAEIVLGGEQ